MKIILHKLILLILISLLGQGTGFAQCSVSSNILTENFNTPTGASGCTGPGDGLSTTTLPAGQTKGAYAASCAGSVKISNNVDHCFSAAADVWKTSATTGNDGGGPGDYALFVDPCGTVPDGSVWCKTVAVTSGQKYNFSAMISSPWDEEKQNDPDVYLTIGGVAIGSNLCIEQYTSSGPTPYTKQCYTYTIPTTGNMDFCINVKQRTSGVSTTPCSGTYGANGQGNDILVDDIKIDLVTGGGCTSGSACSVTNPVELIIFEGEKASANRALLKWVTASEKNTFYFSIEKSSDGQHFTEIGRVNAQGNSASLMNYEYGDYYFTTTSYYRLKMMDIDGTYKYSSVAILENTDANASIVSAVDGKLEIKAIANEDTQWILAVYSLLGQQYINEKILLKKGENSIVREIGGGESAKIIRITSLEGSVVLSKVIVW